MASGLATRVGNRPSFIAAPLLAGAAFVIRANEGRKPTLLHCGTAAASTSLSAGRNEGRKPTLLHCGAVTIAAIDDQMRNEGRKPTLLHCGYDHLAQAGVSPKTRVGNRPSFIAAAPPRRAPAPPPKRGSETDPPSLRRLYRHMSWAQMAKRGSETDPPSLRRPDRGGGLR